jgi:phosphopentomutase
VERENGQVGIDSPALGVYNDRLCIQHMGYGVDPEQQAPSILSRMGINVALFGKMADLVVCPGATKNPIVPTPRLMEAVLDCCRRVDRGLIAATVQETDLAAHAGDLCRLASVLEQADRGIGALLAEIAEGDVLIVCADHGNDPRLNIGLHTREETPLLVYQKARRGSALGVRDTMADIGATAAHVFGAPSTRDGSIMLNGRNT